MADTDIEQQVQDQQDPPTKKLGVKEFAAKIKAKYPDYNSIDDSTLVQKILDKYPTYKDQVDLTPQKKNSADIVTPPSNGSVPGVSPSTEKVKEKILQILAY